MKTHWKRAGLASSVIVAALGLVLAVWPDRSEAQPAAPRESELNEVLSNELSAVSELEGMDKKVDAFLQKWDIKGASLAIMRNDSLLYAKGYGWADEAEGIHMQPSNLLRMASVSKLITATDIMILRDKGLLSLDDHIFGEGGLLSDMPYAESISDRNYHKITVEHLLRHQGGFTVSGGDPMFSTRTVMSNFGLDEAPDNETLISCMLKRRLRFQPGQSQAYSNFGYLLLSQVVEKCSGQSYEEFTRDNIFKPLGIKDFHIANNYYAQRWPGEVRYYVPSNEPPVPEYNCSGRMVTRCYGGNDIHALSGAGAWVGSVPELMKFVAAIDGREGISDVVSAESVKDMVAYFDEATFSLGWNDTKPSSGWMRSGSFSGTSALVKYFPDGECWIMITNASNWKGAGFSKIISTLFSDLRRSYSSSLPARDFFHGL